MTDEAKPPTLEDVLAQVHLVQRNQRQLELKINGIGAMVAKLLEQSGGLVVAKELPPLPPGQQGPRIVV